MPMVEPTFSWPFLRRKSSLYEPLIDKETVVDVEDCSTKDSTTLSDGSDVLLENAWDMMCGTILVVCLVAGTVAATIAAMMSTSDVFILIAGGIGIINALIVLSRHYLILNSSSLRKRTNILLKQANRLIETAEFAEKSVQVLHEAKDEWRNTECRLRTIARRQSTTVNEIIKLVKENEAMLDEIKSSLQKTVVVDMTKSILESYKTNSMVIDMEEAPLLVLRLRIRLEKHGVYLDHGKFLAMLEDDNDVMTVLKFCREALQIVDEGDDLNDAVGIYQEQDLPFDDFCQQMIDTDEMKVIHEALGKSEMMKQALGGMISVSNDYFNGSVEVARGKRMSVMSKGVDIGERRLDRKRILNDVKRRMDNAIRS